jgi:hypothetical protein
MGTNYYLKEASGKKHIGKSSGGWCFALHIIPEENIHDLSDWENRWSKKGTRIEDEYGRRISQKEMCGIIKNRQWGNGESFSSRFKPGIGFDNRYQTEAAFHRDNHSFAGENGLLRHHVDGLYCVKNGEGTWDCMPGVFS